MVAALQWRAFSRAQRLIALSLVGFALCTVDANAQSGKDCQDDSARVAELQRRIALYEKRVGDAEVARADAEVARASAQQEYDASAKTPSDGDRLRAAQEKERLAIGNVRRAERELAASKKALADLQNRPACPVLPKIVIPMPNWRFWFSTGIELGGGAGDASYDDLRYDTRGFVGGGFAALRANLSNNWFVGGQVSALGAGLSGQTHFPNTSIDVQGTIRTLVPIDAQIGAMLAPSSPVAIYAFAGPLWGWMNVKVGSSSETVRMFGASGGVGVDYSVTAEVAVGAKLRFFSLGPDGPESEGLHQKGVIGTVNLSYRFGLPESGRGSDTTVLSDRRLKRDIIELARLDNGLGLYRYRYLWSTETYVGVMAQEVAQARPDAVVRGADGYLRVNYTRLGLQALTWDEWIIRE